MNNQDVGFILGIVPYKEADAMIEFLGESMGLQRLVVPGLYKATSKQSALSLAYSKVRIRLNYKENRLNRIQNGELLNAYVSNRSDYDWLLEMSLIAELIVKLYDSSYHGMWYAFIDEYLEAQDLSVFIAFLARLIRLMGVLPNIDGCVVTGSTQIADFSVQRGGFVSLEYKDPNHRYSLDFLKMIRYLFSVESYDIHIIDGLNEKKLLFKLLLSYLEYHLDVKFNSMKLIIDV